MATIDLSYIRNLFGEGTKSEGDEQAYRELLLMVLARSTDADCYTHPAEIEAVQRVIKEQLNEDISEDNITSVATTDLYQSAPLETYISRLAPKLSIEQRQSIVHGLMEVMRSDGQVAASEIEYFNEVVMSLRLTYAEVVGLC
jgi:uncharacterized tellurite resistance protein B-like protein